MTKNKVFLTIILAVLSIALEAQQLAFPEAEGFGKYATGGRNGTVYHVTNLNDSGTGSFRDAVSQPNRIVVFDVGGVINIGERIVINKNITVAGQTAPGGGITIYGNGVACNDNSGNSIIRYIRIRMGKNGDYRKDALGISAGTDYIFDHVSVSWGWDGTVDINGTTIDRITMQDCIIGQGIDIVGHSTGGLFESGSKSIIRTLWIDNETRNPKAKGPQEFINSVIYNWGGDGYIMGSTSSIISECNLVGSYFIAGPSSNTGNYVSNTTPEFHLYASDNWLDADKDGTLDGSELDPATDFKTATMFDTPFSHPGVNTILTAQQALDHVIKYSGASLARDEVDKLLIEQLLSYGKKGSIIFDEDDNGIEGGVGAVANGPKPTDTDNDGMPDEWEDANGLNKNSDDAMTIAANGYANIENYINSITESMEFLIQPTNLAATEVTANSVSISWNNNESTATQQVIEYGTSSTSFTESITVDGSASSATITDLESGTMYYIRIKAENETMSSAYSGTLSVQTVVVAIPPKACINPSPANGSTVGFSSGIVLDWDNETPDLGGILYYDVYMGTSSTDMELLTKKVGSKYVAGDLEDGKTYFWRIGTRNTLGSNDGDVWSFTVAAGANSRLMYFPFDEADGTIADNMVSDNDANPHDLTPAWQDGKVGNGLYFDASQTTGCMIVDHYDALNLGTNPFTISLWFKSDGGGIADTYLLHKGTHDATYGELGTGKWVGIQYKAGSRLTFGIDDNVTKSVLDLTSPDKYFDNEWHHLICMRDVTSDKLKMYMDGELVLEGTDNTGDITETAEFVIGNCNYNFNTPFKGTMDELIVFGNALSDNDIAYLHQSQAVSIKEKELTGINQMKVYPNPFSGQITINSPVEIQSSARVKIVDLQGRTVFDEYLESSGSIFTIDGLEQLPAGFYSCMLISGSEMYFSKLIKE